MAKKKAAGEFNMSLAIRDLLTENSRLSGQETLAALTEKYPSAKINPKSFSVAFYTGRKKLGIGSSRGRKKSTAKKTTSTMAARTNVNLQALQIAAKFLSDVGGTSAALEAIKQLQSLQVK